MKNSSRTLLRIAVVGAGAAGFFAALSAAEAFPGCRIVLYEKSRQVLGKVRVSGGGRCNVTNAAPSVAQLVQGYPRGGKFLRPLFHQFHNLDAVQWFGQRGVPLKNELDGRVFPVSNRSDDVVRCLQREADRLGVEIRLGTGVTDLRRNPESGTWQLFFSQGTDTADRVIVTTGGHPQRAGFDWLARLGHAIVPPVPSLFTFNVPDSPLLSLAGVAQAGSVRLPGTALTQQGPVLLTHWGFSGPAVLRLSAWAARELAERQYQFETAFNWIFPQTDATARETFAQYRRDHARKTVAATPPFGLPQRLWRAFVAEAGLSETTRWAEAPAKGLNKLTDLLVNYTVRVRGKTTFKDEFVTCGGVALSEINPKTLESRHQPGLFFAGEVLDIDGVTGGYNFQAAWTTGYVAGKHAGI